MLDITLETTTTPPETAKTRGKAIAMEDDVWYNLIMQIIRFQWQIFYDSRALVIHSIILLSIHASLFQLQGVPKIIYSLP